MARVYHACTAIMGLDPLDWRYHICVSSLKDSLQQLNQARLVSTDRSKCQKRSLEPRDAADWMPHTPLLGAIELRIAALGFGWADVTATQVYTIFDIHPLFADEIVRLAATPGGLIWHFARPAVKGLVSDGCTRHRPQFTI